tara:strand:- start:801 stop:1013 length:213 start_codon:yes stop_codon:yes gene_type:complete
MRAFWIFIVGTILAVAGVGYALYALGVAPVWIGVAVLVIVGISVASGSGLAKTKSSDTTNVNVESGDSSS